ncbi:glycoside hydrolase family 13 protein [Phaffia rhodozyma]|uniref:alpha-amylase n=1 Tax=Phaffia rhodozyma TaxID=264483 RepID=A0A0F7SNL5_PHARH|nr:glycoside hydrolase family 13 protein [Phaffia rhodozyma]
MFHVNIPRLHSSRARPITYLVLLCLWACLFPSACVNAATKEQWKGRSIYQVITDRYALPTETAPALTTPLPTVCDPQDQTWCGGNWRTIIENLDYIQSMGFTAIWISPVHKNIDTSTPYKYAYHGYWVTDQRALNPRFGDEDDLHALVQAVHDRGMYIMVDIVIQNVPLVANPTHLDVTTSMMQANGYWFTEPAEYHPYCAMDYSNDASAEICWLGDTELALMDINTEKQMSSSRSTLGLANLSQTTQLMDCESMLPRETFWPGFCQAGGVFCIGEVFANDMKTIKRYADNMDSVMNYPAYQGMMDAFQLPGPANMSSLVNYMVQMNTTVNDTHVLGNFIENHDLPRFANTTVDPLLQYNALAFQFIGNDGIPIVYYGQEQGFHSNREPLWTSEYANTTYRQRVAFLHEFRSLMATTGATFNGYTFENASAQILSHDQQTVAIRKGPMMSVLTNRGSPPTNEPYSILNSGWPMYTQLVDIWSCDKLVVGSSESFLISYNVRGGRPVILVPLALISNTTFCPSIQQITITQKVSDSSSSSSMLGRCSGWASWAGLLGFSISCLLTL